MTSSGIPILPFYGEPAPGEFPFTRGLSPEGYRQRFWTMRQYAGYGSARESNRRYRYLLAQGQTGLSIAFDLPTQMGYDSDDVPARGEVGKPGSRSRRSRTCDPDGGAAARIRLRFDDDQRDGRDPARPVARRRPGARGLVGEADGHDPERPPEGVLRARHAIHLPAPSLAQADDGHFEPCGREVPRWNTISISGYHIREAGSTAVQEVAFTLSNAIAYVEAALLRGLAIDDFAPRVSFFFNAHSNFFEEIAKFRAARRLWAEIARGRFGAKDPRSWRLRFHTQTAGSTLTAQQTDVNAVRVAFEALSAVLGGTQSRHTNAADEALALPTESSARLALRTQQVIACETGVADVADPLGGSYLVEAWTEEIADRARALIAKIDALGGSVAAIEGGFFAREIEEAAYAAQRELEEGRRLVVGVNAFREEGDVSPPLLSVDPRIEQEQIERLRAFRAARDSGPVRESLEALQAGAREDRNLVPPILTAVESSATLGEIALKTVWGEHRPG
jgi:methylmalonyl-CoA mutase N-terminal domain/subunit